MDLWLLVLLVVCGLYGAWRKWGGQLVRSARAPAVAELQTRGVKRLTPKHSVHVVVWHGREYLLGCSEHEVTLIATADAEAAPQEPTP